MNGEDDDADDHTGFDALGLACHRCGAALTAGEGSFYVVNIEAYADPSPPTFDVADLQRDTRDDVRRLIDQLRDASEQEMMDQVYRRLTLHLCGRCYRQWIENPTG